jgi:hypothetical protein
MQEKLQFYSSFEWQTHVGINSNLFYIYSVFNWWTHKPMSAVMAITNNLYMAIASLRAMVFALRELENVLPHLLKHPNPP